VQFNFVGFFFFFLSEESDDSVVLKSYAITDFVPICVFLSSHICFMILGATRLYI
jgi:hypothetical protein